jgi:hypothetical protein
VAPAQFRQEVKKIGAVSFDLSLTPLAAAQTYQMVLPTAIADV